MSESVSDGRSIHRSRAKFRRSVHCSVFSISSEKSLSSCRSLGSHCRALGRAMAPHDYSEAAHAAARALKHDQNPELCLHPANTIVREFLLSVFGWAVGVLLSCRLPFLVPITPLNPRRRTQMRRAMSRTSVCRRRRRRPQGARLCCSPPPLQRGAADPHRQVHLRCPRPGGGHAQARRGCAAPQPPVPCARPRLGQEGPRLRPLDGPGGAGPGSTAGPNAASVTATVGVAATLNVTQVCAPCHSKLPTPHALFPRPTLAPLQLIVDTLFANYPPEPPEEEEREELARQEAAAKAAAVRGPAGLGWRERLDASVRLASACRGPGLAKMQISYAADLFFASLHRHNLLAAAGCSRRRSASERSRKRRRPRRRRQAWARRCNRRRHCQPARRAWRRAPAALRAARMMTWSGRGRAAASAPGRQQQHPKSTFPGWAPRPLPS